MLRIEQAACRNGTAGRDACRCAAWQMALALMTVLAGASAAPAADTLQPLGQWGGASESVAVSGTTAYVGMGRSLVVVDVSSLSVPAELGRVALPNTVQDIAVSGTFAYVAAAEAGFRVIDVSNPAVPRVVGACGTPGAANDLVVAGSFAYVAADDAGLVVVNIANPTTPYVAGVCDTPGAATSVVIDGNFAFVADYDGGLVVVDITNPATPRRFGRITMGRIGSSFPAIWPSFVAVAGGYAYVGHDYYGLVVVDLSQVIGNETPPVTAVVGSSSIPGYERAVVVSGNYAYVATETDGTASAATGGLVVVNVANPAAPAVLGSYTPNLTAVDVALMGDHAYLANENGGLEIINVGMPAAPTRVGGFDGATGRLRGVTSVGNYTYLCDRRSGLSVLNTADPLHPVRIGGYRGATGEANACALAGGYLYLANGAAGLDILDVSNPAGPVRVGGASASYAFSVALAGNQAYVARVGTNGNGYLMAFDISNPAAPASIPGYTSATSWIVDVAAANGYVFLADTLNGLVVLSESNLTAPVATLAVPGGAWGVAVLGNYAYVADGDVRVIDVSNPAAPALVATFVTEGDTVDVTASGDRIRAASAGGGVQVLDVSNPLSPKLAGHYAGGGLAFDATTDDSVTTLVADETGGLLTLAQVGDLDIDGDVDGSDYFAFANCFNGTGNVVSAPCGIADTNGDNYVDGIDYGLFASCFNGTGNPPACR